MKKYQIIAISGSLRKDSFNTMTIHAMEKLAPTEISIELVSISDFPIYNFDVHDKEIPPAVKILNDKIKMADALIIVTPEYNYSIPGGLKNAIDFISRSADKPFDLKPVGILGASPGLMGSSRAQYHLRQILLAVNAMVMNKPEVMISLANTKFDDKGHLKDEDTKKHLTKFILSLVNFIDVMKPS